VVCRAAHTHAHGCASHLSEACEPENALVAALKRLFVALGLLQYAEAMHDSTRAAAAITLLILAATAAQFAAGGRLQVTLSMVQHGST
jgi:hypothetical protein